MNSTIEQSLIAKLKALSPEQIAEVETFMDFVSAKSKRQLAWQRLLSLAPAIEAAGVEPLSEAQAMEEVRAVREARRAKQSI
jgi:urease accessory protein UreF